MGLDLRREHGGTMAQRHLDVGEGQLAPGRRHEFLAPDDAQQVEDVDIEHRPGADLLFNHVVAGLFQIHDATPVLISLYISTA